MTRQGELGVIGWFKDFLHGLRLSWGSAWDWQKIYRLERRSAEEYPMRIKALWDGPLERRASEKRIDEKLAALDAKRSEK